MEKPFQETKLQISIAQASFGAASANIERVENRLLDPRGKIDPHGTERDPWSVSAKLNGAAKAAKAAARAYRKELRAFKKGF